MENNESMGFMSDEKIIELYFSRDESAIDETDKKYGRYLLAIARNILGNSQDSEECVNDTYLRTWLSVPPTRPRSLKAYLSKLTRGRAINRYDELRSHKRVPADMCAPFSELENTVAYADGIEYDQTAKAIGKIIGAYLDTLPDRSVYIFVARYFYARSIAEIAGRLRVSTSTVNKELATMKKELRLRLLKGGINI